MERVPEDEAIAEPVDARRFNEVMGSNRFRQADYRRLACRAVDVGIPPGGTVLDMSTGPGFVAIEVAKLLEGTGCRVVGVDLSRAGLAGRGRFYGLDGCEVDMPRLVKGAKWTFGWVVVGPEREIAIPPEAWAEYGFQAGDEAIFTLGSCKSGGFGISTSALMAEASGKMGGADLRELGRGRFGDGRVGVPPEVGVEPGDRLLTVRGSRYGLGFVAQGLIYEEALKHPELEVFA